jgi:hypothetical protein
MAIPKTSNATILKAIGRYERGERSPTWPKGSMDWRDNQSHRYAIRHSSEIYPVKEIVRIAVHDHTREWFTSFSGGAEANRYVQEYGFEVVEKPFS